MKLLLSEKKLAQTIKKLASEIAVSHGSLENIILVGIQTRGVPLAERILKIIKSSNISTNSSKRNVSLGSLDINLYRDDLSTVAEVPIVKQTDIPVSIEGKGIILVDDVLYTGRTVRAALDALIDLGRP